ncbi:hypothetical protein GGS26DRAFT_117917 [Hypomontagnella submonticulosa]|nr:hypothetical protein GGS26DRAFT_117917 [Hypomontagnella submonticulosa]
MSPGFLRATYLSKEDLSMHISLAILLCSIFSHEHIYAFLSGTFSNGVTLLTTRAGVPIATLHEGILFVTTELAAIVHPSPIVTPGRITTCPPIQQSSPIVTGLAYSTSSLRLCTSVSWVAVNIDTFGPNITRSPIVTNAQSKMVRLKLE